MEQIIVKISGRVQGVGFRYFTRRRGLSLGLSGYAANLADGDVEVVAQGPPEKLRQFVSMLRLGPPAAEVDDVEVVWRKVDNKYAGFEIR